MNANPSDPLIETAVIDALGPLRDALVFEVQQTGTSSNQILLEAPALGIGTLRALAIEHQSAGRGRRGRSWRSFGSHSLAFSVRWERAPDAPVPLGLSLAVGVAVARALEGQGSSPIALKWPNDLIVDGRKAGGILVELARAGASQSVVIGIGLNLSLPSDMTTEFPLAAVFGQNAPSRNRVLAALLCALFEMLRQFDKTGFASFCADWNTRHAHAGCEVELQGDLTRTVGVARGVDTDGALLIETAGGLQRVLSGDVSLRVAA